MLLDSGNGVFGLRTRDHSVLHGATDWELYDIAVDPAQSASLLPDGVDPNVSDALRHLLKGMREETEAFAAEYPDGQELEDFEVEQAERMADLGYFGDEEPVDVRELDAALEAE